MFCFQKLPHPPTPGPENCAINDVMWKDILDQSRLHMTVRGMRIVFWIPKATNTHSEYVILIVFPLLLWLGDVPQCYVVCTLSTVILALKI
jgi:hypothetical protein